MPLVAACVAPHGFEIIADVAGPELTRFAGVRRGMEILGEQMQAARPDTIVIATPHGFRVEGAIALATTSFAAGHIEKFGSGAELALSCDRDFALNLHAAAKLRGLPVRGVTFGSAAGSWSVLPLDWGTLIPMWFLGGRQENPPQVVVITTSRDVGLDALIELGDVVASLAKDSPMRIAFVASADEAHAHQVDGPYGYHEAAKVYDDLICRAVNEQNLEQLTTLDSQFVDDAKPDSLWQMVMLLGIQRHYQLRGTVVSYDVPTYYGMMCASYEVLDEV